MRLLVYAGIGLAYVAQIAAASLDGLVVNETQLAALSRELPKCAWNCWIPLVSESECAINDAQCLCTNVDFHQAAGACVRESCTAEEDLTATRIQKSACGFPVRDRSHVTLVTEWTLFAFTVIAVALRFLARAPVLGGKGYGWDDWTILISLLLLVPLNALLNIMLNLGLGKDKWMLEPRQITGVLFWFWVEEYMYSAVVLSTKISILLLYIRLFPETDRWFRPACLVLIGATIVTAIPVFFSILFQCRPISYAWHKWDATHSGTCINTVAQIATLAAVNMILDIVIILLPVPKLLKLNVSTGKKTGVIAVFTVGLFVTITSAVRLQYVVNWGESQNPTWQYNPLAIWSEIECHFTVICACMPPLAGPIKRVFKGTIANRVFDSDSARLATPRPRILPFGRAKRLFQKDPVASSKLPTFITVQRDFGSTDELELVGRSHDQQTRDLHGT